MKAEPSFHAIVKLCRITNSLRFLQYGAYAAEDLDSPAASRQMMHALLATAALLFEALRFTETLGKHFSALPEFSRGFGKLHSDEAVKKAQRGVLERARNKLVYHIEDSLPAESLEAFPVAAPFVLASGATDRAVDVHYTLADAIFVHYLLDTPADGAEFKAKFAQVLTEMLELSIRFAECSDNLIAAYFQGLGASTETY